jgi:hypothetical protein
MPELPQRWLSLSGICTTLNLTPSQIKTLYNQRLLVRIGKNHSEHRYLDPTPEYAERLRLAAVMLSRKSGVNIDLPMSFILTAREVAEIMGWSIKHARRYLVEKKIPCYKSKNRALLYSVTAVRDMIFQRQGRHLAKQKAPFLLAEILAYQKRFQAAEEAMVPVDELFEQDIELQKKLNWMMRQPNRDPMLRDFIEKMELAKKVLNAASETASPGESGTRR